MVSNGSLILIPRIFKQSRTARAAKLRKKCCKVCSHSNVFTQMKFEDLSAKRKNTFLTIGFYLLYASIAALLFFALSGSPRCGPGPNAILIVVFPFVVGILTLLNIIKTVVNRDHVGSLAIHLLIAIVLLFLIFI